MTKYQNIHTAYNKLIEKNSNNIYLKNDSYYFKISNNVGNSNPESLRLLLKYEGKDVFMKTDPNGNLYSIYQNTKPVEEIFFPNKDNFDLKVENLITNLSIRYLAKDKRLYATYYEKNKDQKNDIVLAQMFRNCTLVAEKNYKKDFRIDRKQLLKKLPKNFYDAALEYLEKQKNENKITNEEYTQLKKNAELIKNKLEAGEDSNEFFKKVYISKMYSDDETPVYQVGLPKRPDGNFVNWLFEINARNNTVHEISYIPHEF